MLSDPDSIARLAYLLLLLAAVGGFFFFGGGQKLSKSVRDFGIWVLIFAMVIIAFGFRDVLTGELFPHQTAQVSGDAVELRRSFDGHFHARLEIDDVPVSFIVDTGASEIVLSLQDARRVGIDPDRLSFSGRASTANGTVRIAPIRLDSVQLGPFEERNVSASVNGGQLHSSLLGMSYLERFAKIEISGDTMRLVR
ncbi:MAG: TIGR02281 family clan AA aspartic protease [Pseudomonadota bacterium]